jgi:hypothetical protein
MKRFRFEIEYWLWSAGFKRRMKRLNKQLKKDHTKQYQLGVTEE